MQAQSVPLEVALRHFLDERGRLTQFPAKRAMKLLACRYLQGKLDKSRRYAEREISDALDEWTAFHDPATLRREMFDAGLLCRERDGSAYWVAPDEQANEQ